EIRRPARLAIAPQLHRAGKAQAVRQSPAKCPPDAGGDPARVVPERRAFSDCVRNVLRSDRRQQLQARIKRAIGGKEAEKLLDRGYWQPVNLARQPRA